MPLLDRRGLYANFYEQLSPANSAMKLPAAAAFAKAKENQDVVTGLPLPSTSETEMKPHA